MTDHNRKGHSEPRPHTPQLCGDDSDLMLQEAESSARNGNGDQDVFQRKEGNADDDNTQEIEDEDDYDEDDDDDDCDYYDKEEEEEEEEEPRLKYVQLTQNMGAIYRNGDATSAFLVAGDKMIIGTHNGSIHVIQLPTFQSIRVYHAHSASVTSISISPYPPTLSGDKPEAPSRLQASQARPTSRHSDVPSPAAASRRSREPPTLPRLPSNDIYVSTSSMDGNVCTQSLLDVKEVQLRDFARPLQAVALSPEYKLDRTYLSGGLAGQLILTVGGSPGQSSSTVTGTAAATASGWLGSIGLGHNTGKDTILHSGEGTISNIKWSLSGKYVAWLNEYGIKVMRSKLHLDGADSDHAWKRLAHIDRPQTDEWETMASVWKGRAEWIDEKAIETSEMESRYHTGSPASAAQSLRKPTSYGKKITERLLVGWGGTIWIIHVHPEDVATDRNAGDTNLGRAEIAKILRMDCIISGISLYTRDLLLVLVSCSAEGKEDGQGVGRMTKGGGSRHSQCFNRDKSSRGLKRRPDNQPPELRLIDLNSEAEIDKDNLSISRSEKLSSSDYHLSVLPAHTAASAVASKGTLEALAGFGTDMWNAAINPKSLFSSGASIKSKDSGDDVKSGSKATGTASTIRPHKMTTLSIHPSLAKPGAKIFIHSPYDCILGTKRDLSDHLAWLLKNEHFERAWELVDENPDLVVPPEKPGDVASLASSSRPCQGDEFYDDESITDYSQKNLHSAAEREKRRIGELWIQELIEEGNWISAGRVCGKVLSTADRWEKWAWTFAGAKKFDEITGYVPSRPMQPPIPSTIYEVLLGHYLQDDKPRFQALLEAWSTDLYDVGIVCTALENQVKFRDVREDTVNDGDKGRDWRIVMGSLARMYEAGGRRKEALKCYIKLNDADSAFGLIRDAHLAEAVVDDIPGFIGLRVEPGQRETMSKQELAEVTSEAITLLVDEALHGLVRPEVVVKQLKEQQLKDYLYFYLKGLWRGEGIREHTGENMDRLVMESKSLVDDFADMAVHLFSMYDRPLLMEFLKSSTSYTFEKAVEECEAFEFYDELVYLYSKTGQMKRALNLIIDRLKQVEKAIEFAKEQDDPELWEDLLNYSMNKPTFIRALLEKVGTAINPIKLVRRIPEGLEIPGLREGLTHMMKEHELQHSISSGAVRVLRSELVAAQNELRAGQRRGIKFDFATWQTTTPRTSTNGGTGKDEGTGEITQDERRKSQAGRCASCAEPLTDYETESLLGFACGHVFHVSHLLEMLHKGQNIDVELVGEQQEGARHLVGAKLMRARLLEGKVKNGCPICQAKDS